MARRVMQGRVVSFLLIGVLFMALLVGGLVYFRHMQTSGNQTTSTDGSSQSTQSQTSESTDKTSKESDLKTVLETQAGADTSTTTAAATTATAAAAALPTTGPEDGFISALGIMMLTGVGVAFARSRRLV